MFGLEGERDNEKTKIQFIVLAVILVVCIGGYFGITSYYKNKESNEKEASTIKVLEIENYKDLTKVSYNYEDATINLVKKMTSGKMKVTHQKSWFK